MYAVEIVEKDTEQVVERIECASLRGAMQTEGGVKINLNRADFFTRIVEEKE